MKRTLFLGAATLSLLAACGPENTYEYNHFGFDNDQAALLKVLYLDQDIDTLGNIISTKSWKAKTDATWLTLGIKEHTVPSGYSSSQYIPLTFAPNTSDEMKPGLVQITNTDNRTLTKQYYQVYFFHILQPEVKYENDRNYKGASFLLNLPADAQADTIKLQLFAAKATVESNVSWVTPEQPEISKRAGYISEVKDIPLVVDPNASPDDRQAKITIALPDGRKTIVTVKQNGY